MYTMAYTAYWTLYHYINVLEEYMYDGETCLMLLERYNGLIHENRFKRNIPENVWCEIEEKLVLAQLSAICGMNDPVSLLEIFAEIKGIVRKYYVSLKMITKRMNFSNGIRDIGSIDILPVDCISQISALLLYPVNP